MTQQFIIGEGRKEYFLKIYFLFPKTTVQADKVNTKR